MKNVCVITGGGSGMGLAAAKCLPKDKIIVLSGWTVTKLENAVKELTELGYEAHAHACDTSDRASVRALAEYAASLGEIKNVINAAGLSPAMASPEKLLRVNALGTVYVNQEFSRLMHPGRVIRKKGNPRRILKSGSDCHGYGQSGGEGGWRPDRLRCGGEDGHTGGTRLCSCNDRGRTERLSGRCGYPL